MMLGPWSGVRTVSDPYEETPSLLYDALNCYIPDPAKGSGTSQRPPISLIHNPLTGRYGQCIHDHTRTDGTIDRFVIRGGHLERWNGSLTGPVFTDLTPTTVQLATTGRVYCVSFGNRLIVNDGVNVPWMYDPATATATRLAYGAATVLLSRSTSDTRVAVASFAYTLSGVTTIAPAAPAQLLPSGGAGVSSSKWGIYRFSVNSAGTRAVAQPGVVQAYNSEALAIAALPATPVGSWDIGYLTVQATGGAAWTSGTDALAGGASGTPAAATHYYGPTDSSWTAYGQPVVYAAKLFFVLNAVEGVSARTTVAWSEEDDPTTGYAQADFDNTWSLTQTSADPLYALAATNAALYYFRRNGIGEITGAVSRAFRTEATLDAVSTSIGTTTPASVLVADDVVWFASEDGLPHRFGIGSRTVDPVWLTLRDTTDAVRLDATVAASQTTCAVTAYQPELRLVIMALWSASAAIADTATTLYAFSAVTGSYHGRWVIGTNPRSVDTLGVCRESTGRSMLCAIGASDAVTSPQMLATRGAFLVQRRTADISGAVPWGDQSDSALIASITTCTLLGDAGVNKRFDRVRARIRVSATALNGTTRRFQVTYDTPWATGLGTLLPVLSDGVADDRVILAGLAVTARWLRITITGPVAAGDILTESGLGILTEDGLSLALMAADTPLNGPVVFEGIEVSAQPLGADNVPR